MAPKEDTAYLFIQQNDGATIGHPRELHQHLMQNIHRRRRAARGLSTPAGGGARGRARMAVAARQAVGRSDVAQESAGVAASTEGGPVSRLHEIQRGGSEPSIRRFGRIGDPFDVFPIGITDKVYELLQWHFWHPYNGHPGTSNHQPVVNFIKTKYRISYWELAKDDSLLIHTLLCNAAVKRAAVANPGDFIFQHHKTKALEVLRQRLQVSDDGSKTALAVAIAEQAFFALIDQDHQAASAHMNALRSGFDWETGGVVGYTASRLTRWLDLCTAAALLTSPWLPLRSLVSIPSRGLPASFHQEMDSLTSTTLQTFQLSDTSELSLTYFELMRLLHTVSRVNIDPAVEIPTLVNELYTCSYNICTVAAAAHSQADRSSMTSFEAVTLGAQLFPWASLRLYILPSVIHKPLITRIYKGLRQQQNLISAWQSDLGLLPLVWLLSTAGICTLVLQPDMAEEHEWLLKLLLEVVQILNVQDSQEFVDILRMFPWTDHICERRYPVLWARICGDLSSMTLEAADFDLGDLV